MFVHINFLYECLSLFYANLWRGAFFTKYTNKRFVEKITIYLVLGDDDFLGEDL